MLHRNYNRELMNFICLKMTITALEKFNFSFWILLKNYILASSGDVLTAFSHNEQATVKDVQELLSRKKYSVRLGTSIRKSYM